MRKRLSILCLALLAGACSTEAPGGDGPPRTPDRETVLETVGVEAGCVPEGEDASRRFEEAARLMEEGSYAEAIRAFNELLPRRVEPLEEGAFPDYDCWDHRAALRISACFEKLGRLDRALEFAKLARDKYPYYDASGTRLKIARAELDQRIRALEEKIEKEGGGHGE